MEVKKGEREERKEKKGGGKRQREWALRGRRGGKEGKTETAMKVSFTS